MRAEELRRKEEGKKSEGSEREGKSKLERLVKQGEWMRLKHNEEFQALSFEGKISIAMDTYVFVSRIRRVVGSVVERSLAEI